MLRHDSPSIGHDQHDKTFSEIDTVQKTDMAEFTNDPPPAYESTHHQSSLKVTGQSKPSPGIVSELSEVRSRKLTSVVQQHFAPFVREIISSERSEGTRALTLSDEHQHTEQMESIIITDELTRYDHGALLRNETREFWMQPGVFSELEQMLNIELGIDQSANLGESISMRETLSH